MFGGSFAGRLWLIRHGETEGQSSVRFHGSNDVALSDLGRQQIRALVPFVRGLEPGLLVHSPLSRAAESAAILIGDAELQPQRTVVEERMREICFGDCEGMTREEIDQAHPGFWDRHARGEVEAFPGGETRTAFRDRVLAALRDVGQASTVGDVVVVAHRGIVRHGLRCALGVPDDREDPFTVELGSLSVVRKEPGQGPVLELYDFVP